MTAMKKNRICLLAALCGAMMLSAACGEQRLDVPSETFEVMFTLDDGGGATRATSAASAATVADACLYLCNAQGVVVDAVRFDGSSVSAKFAAGTYTAHAVVNCGAQLGAYANATQVEAAVRQLTGEASGSFSMYGTKTFTVPQDASCAVPVTRLLSMVELDEIAVDFSARPSLASATLTVDSIYLINVVGAVTLADNTTGSHDTWLNKRWPSGTGVMPLLAERVNASVASGAKHSTKHYFYCYQNNTATDSRAAAWGARYTRLVVACTLAGQRTYYPIDIHDPSGTLHRNRRYVIGKLSITGYGAPAPDEPVPEEEAYGFSATVKVWDGTYTVPETL